jgi:hypothetical protein
MHWLPASPVTAKLKREMSLTHRRELHIRQKQKPKIGDRLSESFSVLRLGGKAPVGRDESVSSEDLHMSHKELCVLNCSIPDLEFDLKEGENEESDGYFTEKRPEGEDKELQMSQKDMCILSCSISDLDTNLNGVENEGSDGESSIDLLPDNVDSEHDENE